MSYQCFVVQVDDHVAHVQFNRPDKRNSMVAAFWAELPTLVNELDDRGDIRAIVLSSTGPHFTSGMDISVFAGTGESGNPKAALQKPARFYDVVRHLQASFTSLEKARVPVLAAVQGGCIGAGVDLVSACDMRYATRDAFFTIFETNIGMTADVGTFPRLCKLMPDGLVRELAYTGRKMSGEEAKDCGLVNAVYDTQEEMVEAVLGIACEIAKKAPMAVYGCKQMILHARDHSVADTLDHVAVWNAGFFQTEEVKEAMMANQQKRKGDFVALPSRDGDDDSIELP